MKSKSGSFVYDDMLRSDPEWTTCRWYHLGDRVRWHGIVVRCGIDHYAGDMAVDPWDPGWGWDVRTQTRMWRVLTPGIVDKEKEREAA